MFNNLKLISVILFFLILIGNQEIQARQDLSPSNGQIVFSSDRDGNMEIYVMRPDGSHVRRLTFDDRSDQYPDWSPDGTKIAFSSYRNGPSDIYIINEDGTGLVNLTLDPSVGDRYPAWSPDGTKIAFSRYTGNGADVYTISADGTDLTRIIDGNNTMFNLYPTWSPDGNRILYVSAEHIVSSREFGAFRLMQVDLISNEQTELQAMSAYGVPDWSWANNTILVCSSFTLSGTVIQSMAADGTLLDVLTSSPTDGTRYDSFPSWSPDGTRFVFHSEFLSSTLDRSGSDFDVFVANSDGSGLVNLTPNNDADDMWPDW